MASLTIRNLEETTKRKLKVRAAIKGRSVEQEAREILKSALQQKHKSGAEMVSKIRALFEPLGGAELEPLSARTVARPGVVEGPEVARFALPPVNGHCRYQRCTELMRPAPEPSVWSWVARQSPEHLHVTAITVAEILFGIELLPAGKRGEALRAGAERFFGVVFADHTLEFDDRAARTFSLIACSRRKQGRPISKFDAQIAAIGRAHGTALATRNRHDFEGSGVRLINPGQG